MERPISDEINGGGRSKKVEELDAVDPETVAQLDDTPDKSGDGPSPNEFEGFVANVDTEPVCSEQTDDVPIDASMDELFAE
ncbi:hypothetical protein [Natranaeroarchaeum aerophilus]|uniref:Uncharacterized protein n=1 Tax=Natranaeroarchaeum aerophilus TaxID=2917711 RepID=A0AAE3K6E1_9EURY|nr:hypothetical protein [Natranaeroarchaeum aerophilus]MCL9814841.1 hypothetical protein [Natranaeroarchaeum aerophilus]